ncbi:acetyl-CoA synthetase-like protein [Cristinia sonorae]|uniref:Acetyl-CoA synthetase-like protein n=1 Tax=Cristinia sonorae TaxID=1940300 RepID=A0A8K0USL8_9AGAR|nr:acetyl-CoA synthetase-like protein [Cristinia sonorae]
MSYYKTHLNVLEQSALRFASSPAFKIPHLDADSHEILQWEDISYSQFLSDVEHFAKYWLQRLTSSGVASRSVVGIWLGGMSYVDVLHIFGIMRAGYIPQMFSLRLPNATVIFELLSKSNGQALLYDLSFDDIVINSPIPSFTALDVRGIDMSNVLLPPLPNKMNGEDTVMILHTSGSTSGRPKLVPLSYAWWDFGLQKSAQCTKPYNPGRLDVTVWMGSMCHMGQEFMLSGALQHGTCTVQATSQGFSSSELMDMVTRCGLNRMNQFPSFLTAHLKASRQNPKLLAMLQGLDEIFYSGMPLSQEDEEWVHRHGISLINCFGSTECGSMLLTVPGWKSPAAPLKAIEGTAYGFFPTSSSDEEHQNANAKLLELVILSDSRDCPDASLRSSDGHYHTGDLFIEVSPGHYVSRGRDDDWIKSENSLRCDTRAIEENARMMCNDLISECIVVGNFRPSPVLFVESKTDVDPEKLKKDIIRRTRHFHSRRYLHERITSTNFIVVVPKDTLPRTASKGNIRRRAVEEAFKIQLDHIYGVKC